MQKKEIFVIFILNFKILMKFLALAFIMLVFCVYTILNTLGHKMSEGMP